MVEYIRPGELVIRFPTSPSELEVTFDRRWGIEFHEETPVRRWHFHGLRLISWRKDDNQTLSWRWDGQGWGKPCVLWPGRPS